MYNNSLQSHIKLSNDKFFHFTKCKQAMQKNSSLEKHDAKHDTDKLTLCS